MWVGYGSLFQSVGAKTPKSTFAIALHGAEYCANSTIPNIVILKVSLPLMRVNSVQQNEKSSELEHGCLLQNKTQINMPR